MEYVVRLERKAIKQLKRLDRKTAQRIFETIEQLRTGFSQRLDIKKLRGFRDHYRIRIGDHRILLEVRPNREIIVYAILRREKAYV